VLVDVVHTAELDERTLQTVRALLDESFRSFTEDDWQHALGGLHAIAREGPRVVGHASVVPRRLFHRGRGLRAGYVEAVAVRADRRRRGIGGAMMDDLETVIRTSYELGALSASTAGDPFYVARGWQRWRGETAVLTAGEHVRTAEDDGSVFVLPVTASLDVSARLACAWRAGDVW